MKSFNLIVAVVVVVVVVVVEVGAQQQLKCGNPSTGAVLGLLLLPLHY